MFKKAPLFVLAGALMLPLAVRSEPITLKLSFFTSDRSDIYLNSIKPFVDAVNDEGYGLINIKVYFSGAISKAQADQPELVDDGKADIAIIVPARTPRRFADTSVMELPGLFNNQRQASLVYTRLIELGALQGYSDFFVIGAFVAQGESIHSVKPIASLDALNGLTIRTNNQIETTTLQRLGAKPVPLAINQATDAISRGTIDAATFPPSMLFEFGIGRVTNNHYMIRLGGVPTALVMNRKKFESLLPRAQAIIRKYSGPWLAKHSADGFEAIDRQTLKQLQLDPRRKVIFPSRSDQQHALAVYASVVADWAARSPHNRELLAIVRAEIAKAGSSN